MSDNAKQLLESGSIVRDTNSGKEGYVLGCGYAQGEDGGMYLVAKVIWKGGFQNWAPASRLEVVQ